MWSQGSPVVRLPSWLATVLDLFVRVALVVAWLNLPFIAGRGW